MRKSPRFREVASGTWNSGEWGRFVIRADEWSPTKGAKPQQREMSPERRAALAAGMAAVRASRAV